MAFVLRKYAQVGKHDLTDRRFAPHTPGATQSPQQPGQVPDVSTVPERGVMPIALPELGPKRPATQYKTAEERLDVFNARGLDVLDPERFEQELPSYEERRKADPWRRKPVRPIAGYALEVSGSRLSDQLAALEAGPADEPEAIEG